MTPDELDGEGREIGARALIPRTAYVDAILAELDVDASIVQPAASEHAFRAPERIVDHQQLRRLDGQVAELDAVDLDDRHVLRARDATQQHRPRPGDRQSQSLGRERRHGRGARPGVEHKPEWSLAVDIYRRPYAADAIAERRRDVARLRRSHDDLFLRRLGRWLRWCLGDAGKRAHGRQPRCPALDTHCHEPLAVERRQGA